MTNDNTQEDADFYFDIIQRVGAEKINDLAFGVLWRMRKVPFQDLTGDYFPWPYSGEKKDFSVVDELIWVMHEDAHRLFEDNYRPVIRPHCKNGVATLRDGEEDLLIVATSDGGDDGLTHFETLERVQLEIEDAVFRIVKNHDPATLNEEFEALGYQS